MGKHWSTTVKWRDPFRQGISFFLILSIILLPLSGCGGDGGGESSQTPTSNPSLPPAPERVQTYSEDVSIPVEALGVPPLFQPERFINHTSVNISPGGSVSPDGSQVVIEAFPLTTTSPATPIASATTMAVQESAPSNKVPWSEIEKGCIKPYQEGGKWIPIGEPAKVNLGGIGYVLAIASDGQHEFGLPTKNESFYSQDELRIIEKFKDPDSLPTDPRFKPHYNIYLCREHTPTSEQAPTEDKYRLAGDYHILPPETEGRGKDQVAIARIWQNKFDRKDKTSYDPPPTALKKTIFPPVPWADELKISNPGADEGNPTATTVGHPDLDAAIQEILTASMNPALAIEVNKPALVAAITGLGYLFIEYLAVVVESPIVTVLWDASRRIVITAGIIFIALDPAPSDPDQDWSNLVDHDAISNSVPAALADDDPQFVVIEDSVHMFLAGTIRSNPEVLDELIIQKYAIKEPIPEPGIPAGPSPVITRWDSPASIYFGAKLPVDAWIASEDRISRATVRLDGGRPTSLYAAADQGGYSVKDAIEGLTVGKHQLVLTVLDEFGRTATQSKEIVVQSVDSTAPSITAIESSAEEQVVAGETNNFTVTVEDPSGDLQHGVWYVNARPVLEVPLSDGNQKVSLDYTFNYPGKHTVAFFCWDSKKQMARQGWKLTAVEPPQDGEPPPVVEPPSISHNLYITAVDDSDTNLIENQRETFRAEASCAAGDLTSITWYLDGKKVDPDNCSGEFCEARYAFQESGVGDYLLEAVARDEDGNKDIVAWNIAVRSGGKPPVIDLVYPSYDPVYVSVGGPGVRIYAYANDEDGDLLSLVLDYRPPNGSWTRSGGKESSSGTGHLYWDVSGQNWFSTPGDYDVRFRAYDLTGKKDSITFTITAR